MIFEFGLTTHLTLSLQNIFMAVIIDAYEKLQEMVDWKLSPQMLDDFVWAWAEYDDGSGTISPESFLLVRDQGDIDVWIGEVKCGTTGVVQQDGQR